MITKILSEQENMRYKKKVLKIAIIT